MKRLFILASAAALMLASCAKTTVVYNEAPEEISFKQVTNVMTKVDPETSELTTDMGVFAVLSGSGNAYFSNIQFNATGDVGSKIWKANPAQYYPLQEALDFAFYAPYTNTPSAWTYTNSGQILKSCAYTDVKTTDILFGYEILADKVKQENAYPVTLKHALAKVSIKIKTTATTENLVTITGVTLNQIYDSGTLTVTYGSDVLTSAVWDSKGDKKDYKFIHEQVATTSAEGYSDPIYIVASDYGDNDGCEQTSLVVEYKIKKDGTNEYTGSATLDLSPDTGKAYWEMGKHYIYTINATVYEITFDADVENMTEVPYADVQVK